MQGKIFFLRNKTLLNSRFNKLMATKRLDFYMQNSN